MKAREYYETGLCDEYTTPINEGDEITITGMVRDWTGTVDFKNGQFIVFYEDGTEDPLSEVRHVCRVTKSANHANFNDVLKRKIRQLEKDLIATINEQS